MKISKNLKRVLFFSLFLLLGACKSSVSASKPVDPLCADLWYFPEAPIPVFLNFTPDGRVLGAIGQERFFAPVTYRKNGHFSIDSFAVSRVGDAPSFEKRFLDALKQAEFRRRKGNKMELLNSRGDVVMVLTPVPKEKR